MESETYLTHVNTEKYSKQNIFIKKSQIMIYINY